MVALASYKTMLENSISSFSDVEGLNDACIRNLEMLIPE